MSRILLLQGPNLFRLGKREPHLYGTTTAAELDAMCERHTMAAGHSLEIFYTNSESAAIERIYEAEDSGVDGLVMNPAAFCRAGYGLVNCLKAITMPYIEVHITNVERRDMKSLFGPIAVGVIHGLGVKGYLLALDAMFDIVEKNRHAKKGAA